jgi:hypothetical protein
VLNAIGLKDGVHSVVRDTPIQRNLGPRSTQCSGDTAKGVTAIASSEEHSVIHVRERFSEVA